jgi:ent-kaurene synthase
MFPFTVFLNELTLFSLQWLDLLQSMFTEAEWSRTKTIPTIDDYMQTACVSFGFEPIILSTIYLLGPKLSDDVAENKELNYLLKTVNICGRLLNDIQSFKVYSPFDKMLARG